MISDVGKVLGITGNHQKEQDVLRRFDFCENYGLLYIMFKDFYFTYLYSGTNN